MPTRTRATRLRLAAPPDPHLHRDTAVDHRSGRLADRLPDQRTVPAEQVEVGQHVVVARSPFQPAQQLVEVGGRGRRTFLEPAAAEERVAAEDLEEPELARGAAGHPEIEPELL